MIRRTDKHIALLATCWLFNSVAFGTGSAHAQASKSFDCKSSQPVALSLPCRLKTMRGLDRDPMNHLIRLFKFDRALFSSDNDYRANIKNSEKEIIESMPIDFGFHVKIRAMNSIPDDSPNRRAAVPELFKAFPATHAGCMFTREQLGDVNVSRSFLVAYNGGGQQFAVVHVHLSNVHTVDEPDVDDRNPRILSIEIYGFTPGSRNSNAILKTHILKDPSDRCQNILALMDQSILDELRAHE
ncbi:MAG: hypothetical protein AAF641_05410 [Pseudomonadota bacterium]